MRDEILLATSLLLHKSRWGLIFTSLGKISTVWDKKYTSGSMHLDEQVHVQDPGVALL